MLLIAVAAMIAPVAQAVPIFVNGAQPGSQSGYLLGMDFVVNSPVTVTEMGIFDSNQDGFSGTLEVGIFSIDSLTQNPANSLVSGSHAKFSDVDPGTLVGGSRFKDVPDFTLSPGKYSIVAVGFTSADKSGNTGLSGTTSFNDLGGALTAVSKGGRWTLGATTLALPVANYGGYPQSDPVFQAGTFKVPDTGTTTALLAIAIAALSLARVRWKARQG